MSRRTLTTYVRPINLARPGPRFPRRAPLRTIDEATTLHDRHRLWPARGPNGPSVMILRWTLSAAVDPDFPIPVEGPLHHQGRVPPTSASGSGPSGSGSTTRIKKDRDGEAIRTTGAKSR